jgi:U3 small nucleolar RNA-associated protein 7
MGKPVVTMLAHPSQPVSAIAMHPQGQYMATSGKDGRMKIWDLRTYKKIHDYFTPQPATDLDFSQKGLLSATYSNECQIWKDVTQMDKQKAPYMKYKCSMN